MAGKPKILSLSEFRQLKGEQKSPIIVYFDKAQWTNLTRRLRPSGGRPPRTGLRIALTTLPGLDGGGLVEFRCPVGDAKAYSEGQLRCGDTPSIGPAAGPVDFLGEELRRRFRCGGAIKVDSDGSLLCAGRCEGSGACQQRTYWVGGPKTSPTLAIVCACDG
jgi:hypothetical protein